MAVFPTPLTFGLALSDHFGDPWRPEVALPEAAVFAPEDVVIRPVQISTGAAAGSPAAASPLGMDGCHLR